MSLDKLVEKITVTRAITDIDVDNWDPRTRTGMITKQREAVEELKTLRSQYWKELDKGLAIIVVQGNEEDQGTFEDVTDEEGSALIVRVESLYEPIAKKVDSTLDHKSRAFDFTQELTMISEVTKLAKTLGVSVFAKPNVPSNLQGTALKTFQDVTRFVRRAIESTNGIGLLKMFLESKILELAEQSKYDKPVTPVVVLGVDPDQVSALTAAYGTRIFVIDLTKEKPETNTLIKTYNKIRRYFNLLPKEADPKTDGNETVTPNQQ